MAGVAVAEDRPGGGVGIRIAAVDDELAIAEAVDTSIGPVA